MDEKYTRYAPVPKVAAGTTGGAIATVVIWIAAQFDLTMPPEAAAGIATLATLILAYIAPRDPILPENSENEME